jgi:hypothetical protein
MYRHVAKPSGVQSISSVLISRLRAGRYNKSGYEISALCAGALLVVHGAVGKCAATAASSSTLLRHVQQQLHHARRWERSALGALVLAWVGGLTEYMPLACAMATSELMARQNLVCPDEDAKSYCWANKPLSSHSLEQSQTICQKMPCAARQPLNNHHQLTKQPRMQRH